MKTINEELKKQKQKNIKSRKIKKITVEEKKVQDDIKLKKYIKFLRKIEDVEDSLDRDKMFLQFQEKYGKITKTLREKAAKKYKEKKEDREIDDEEELKLLKAYRKAEKYIKLLRKIEREKDPFKQKDLRRAFDEEYGGDEKEFKLTNEDFSNEELNIRNFLTSIKELTKDIKNQPNKEEIVESVIEMIDDFSNEEDLDKILSQRRKKIFEKIKNNFGFNMIKKFIEAYLDQDQSLDEYYLEYVNIPEIRAKINKMKFADYKKSDNIIPTIPLDKETEVVSEEPKKVYDTDNVDKKCVYIYKRMSWIPYRIKRIYISIVNPSTIDDINKYIIKDREPLKFKDTDWYLANKYFPEFLCSVPLFEKVQNDDILSVKNVNIKVGYKIDLFDNDNSNKLNDDNFIVQNELMFEEEKKYMKNYNISIKEKINKIFDEKDISDDILFVSRSELSSALKRVSNFSEFYDENSEYVNKVIKTAIDNSKDVKSFAEKIGNIIVYLSYDVENISHKIFSNRIRSQYYLPEILVILSPEEKLPEILGNSDVPSNKKERLAKSINIRLDNFIQSFIKKIYDTRNPYDHIPTRAVKHVVDYLDKITIKDWKDKCSNYEDIKDVPNEDLLYYDEKGKTFCLNIRKIWVNFKDKNYKNPYTKKKLSKEFISNFQKTYNIIEEEIIGEEVKETEEIEEELTPDLISLIEDDLNIQYVEEEPEIINAKVEESQTEEEKDRERKYGTKFLSELDPKINELYSRITDGGYVTNKGQVLELLRENYDDVDVAEEYFYLNGLDIEKIKGVKKTSKSNKKLIEESDGEESEKEESDGEESEKEENEESYKPTPHKNKTDEKICKNCLKKCNKVFKSFVGKKLNYFCKLKCMEDYKF